MGVGRATRYARPRSGGEEEPVSVVLIDPVETPSAGTDLNIVKSRLGDRPNYHEHEQAHQYASRSR